MKPQFTTQWYNPVIRVGKTAGKWMTGVEKGDWESARDSITGMKSQRLNGRLLVHIPLKKGEDKIRLHILVVMEWDKIGHTVYQNLGLIEKLSEKGINIG